MQKATTVSKLSDSQLVALLRENNEWAVETLLERYHARLLSYAFRLLGSRETAEDAVQEALVRFLGHLQTLHDPTKLRSYLYQIVTHCCRDQQRQHAMREIVVQQPPDTSVDHDTTERFYIAAFLKELSPRHAEVLVLRYYEDLDLDTIASVLSLPVGTVKSRLHYALNRLRNQITEASAQVKAGALVHE